MIQYFTHSVHQRQKQKDMSLCKSCMFKNKNHILLGSMIKKRKKSKKFHRFLTHVIPTYSIHAKKGTLSVVYWQQCAAKSTSHEKILISCLIKHTIKTTLNTLNMIKMYSISDSSIVHK